MTPRVFLGGACQIDGLRVQGCVIYTLALVREMDRQLLVAWFDKSTTPSVTMSHYSEPNDLS